MEKLRKHVSRKQHRPHLQRRAHCARIIIAIKKCTSSTHWRRAPHPPSASTPSLPPSPRPHVRFAAAAAVASASASWLRWLRSGWGDFQDAASCTCLGTFTFLPRFMSCLGVQQEGSVLKLRSQQVVLAAEHFTGFESRSTVAVHSAAWLRRPLLRWLH